MRQGLERLKMHFFHDKTLFAEIQVAKAQAAKVQVAKAQVAKAHGSDDLSTVS